MVGEVFVGMMSAGAGVGKDEGYMLGKGNGILLGKVGGYLLNVTAFVCLKRAIAS